MKAKPLIVIGVLLLVALVYGCASVSYKNREASLRVDFENEQRANQADFDNMYKTIAQKYQVTGDFAQTLKEVTGAAVQGRQGGTLAKFVTEAYPNLDPGLYREMMATIEGKRNQFQSRQMRLSDIAAVHKKLLVTFPASWFVGDRKTLEVQLVTSGRTGRAFDTGQDNEIDLHGPASRPH